MKPKQRLNIDMPKYDQKDVDWLYARASEAADKAYRKALKDPEAWAAQARYVLLACLILFSIVITCGIALKIWSAFRGWPLVCFMAIIAFLLAPFVAKKTPNVFHDRATKAFDEVADAYGGNVRFVIPKPGKK